MNKYVRMLGLVAAMSLALGLMALPAAANPPENTGTVIFVGTAQVCATDLSNKPTSPGCGNNKPAGERTGLYLIGQPGGNNVDPGIRIDPLDKSKWTDRSGTWKFQSTVACASISLNGIAKTCEIEAAGDLVPVPAGPVNIGAACGVSRGQNGTGELRFPTNNAKYTLSNVGWTTSAGGTLPVQGNYTNSAPKTGGTAGKTGTFAGVVQAQGGQGCIKSPVTGKSGASTFQVAGSVAVV